MPRYAPVISQSDLQQLIVDKAIENDYVEDYGVIDYDDPDMSRIIHMLLEENLDQVVKDWYKIDFSTENLTVSQIKQTPDGIAYFEIIAGGDWETPLVCIIYFDGKKFRGYVPKDGNSYNHKEKSAFGNNDNDTEQAAKQFGFAFDDDYVEVDPNMDLIDIDINSRLEAKGQYAYVAKKVVSKAATVADRQAKIEKNQNLSGPITPDMVYAVISLAAGCSYVEFKLRSSGRMLRPDECHRVTGVPSRLKKTVVCDSVLWYAPQGCYPMQTLATLEAAGFTKAPDNDISLYINARTVYI